MSEFFKPYEGRAPYLFVSYAHKNSERVLPVIRPLHEQNYRIWYDEGIPAGSDWPKNIAQHMRYAGAVLFFISAESLQSPNCLNEIDAATQQGKPILCLRLDDTPLSGEWAAMLDKAPVAKPAAEPAAQAASILEESVVTEAFLGDGTSDDGGGGGRRGFNGWILAAVIGVLLLIGTGGGAYGLSNGWFDAYLPAEEPAPTPLVTAAPTPAPTPAPTLNLEGPWAGMLIEYAVFPDALQERAVRSALGQAEGEVRKSELLRITELHLCGNMALKSGEDIAFDSAGKCSVNGAPVIQGSVSDLGLIADMLALTRLTLAMQQLRTLAPLNSLALLTELNAAGNALETVGGIDGMVSLRELHLEHTNVRDLRPLNALPSLTTVIVSADMFPLTLDPATQRYDVVLAP